MKKKKSIKGILYLLVVLWGLFLYFTTKPAFNVHSVGFWTFLLMVLTPFLLISIDFNCKASEFLKKGKNKLCIIIICILVVIYLLSLFVGLPLFGGLESYRNRIKIPESSSFNEIERFDQTQVQIIDKNIAMSLADRVFGEMGAEIVSQYEISDNYSSIVVNNTMYRVTPVEYSSLIKWISTSKNGTPGFITVNVTTGETKFNAVKEGLRYMPNGRFIHNLDLKLRLSYPTFIFGQSKFEIDDNGKPYWVTQVMKYAFISKAEDVKGVVVTDPVTGDSEYYEVKDVPSWVDNVYDAKLISRQYDAYGRYINGLFNFSERGITAVTDDYAYLQKNGHLWMYTGITSVGNDESNVGFIYVDLQNKDVVYIISAGAEEYSARASAEGAVQEKGYSAVFPTMVNVEGEPTYFMGLKDNAGLIKAYAFVSYKNYQKVGIGTTVNEALKNFVGRDIVTLDRTESIEIDVADIKTAVINGYTIYFIESADGNYYKCSIEVSDRLPFVKTGDHLKLTVSENTVMEVK